MQTVHNGVRWGCSTHLLDFCYFLGKTDLYVFYRIYDCFIAQPSVFLWPRVVETPKSNLFDAPGGELPKLKAKPPSKLMPEILKPKRGPSPNRKLQNCNSNSSSRYENAPKTRNQGSPEPITVPLAETPLS